MSSNTLHFLSFKGNIIWTCAVRSIMSPPVACSSPEAALLLVSTKNRYLWPRPTRFWLRMALCKHNRLRPESIRFVKLDWEHVQSDGKWTSGVGPGQRSRFLVLTKQKERGLWGRECPCRIYLICQKSSHCQDPFLHLISATFFLSYWGYRSHWDYEIKNIGHRARFTENEHLFLCRA